MKKFWTLLLLAPLSTLAQDLTGIWRGVFYTNQAELITGSGNKYEVQINNVDRGVAGVSYSWGQGGFYGKSTLVGMWSAKSSNLVLKEDILADYRNAKKEDVSMFTCYLEYHKEGNKEILEGNYDSENYITKKPAGGGRIYLERVTETDFPKEDFILEKERKDARKKDSDVKPKTQTITPVKPLPTNPMVKKPVKPNPQAKKPVIPNPQAKKPVITAKPPIKPRPDNTKPAPFKITPPVLITPAEPREGVIDPPKRPQTVPTTELPSIFKERKNELVQTILTPGPEISIELYDNGEVDGDIISVFQNGKLIASKKPLSTTPITIKLKIDEDNPEQEITMVAENLGSIPPNTALMIVKSAGKRYDLRISSSEQNNAVVKFRYQAANK